MYWVFNSNCFDIYVNLTQTGTTFFGITQEKIENFIFPLPPIEEQELISYSLDAMTNSIDNTITNIQQQIGKLKEFRHSLISYAVTGKINLREEIIV